MKLYSMSIAAKHVVDGYTDIRIVNSVSLAESNEQALQEGEEIAGLVFPVLSGWEEHLVTIMEIPNGMEFSGFRLTWQAEQVSQSASNTNS